MKGYRQAKRAREKLNDELAKYLETMTDTQFAMFLGISTALQWMCDEGGDTLDRLMAGEPVCEQTQEGLDEMLFKARGRMLAAMKENSS